MTADPYQIASEAAFLTTNPSHGQDVYLTEANFCTRYNTRPRTAQRWRITGDGPPFVRLGRRKVGYRLSDCEKWAAERTFSHRAAELARKALVLFVCSCLSIFQSAIEIRSHFGTTALPLASVGSRISLAVGSPRFEMGEI